LVRHVAAEFDDGDMGTVRRSGIRLKSVPFFTEKPYERPVLANPESLVKEEKKRYSRTLFRLECCTRPILTV
jgi:hypothetical protein